MSSFWCCLQLVFLECRQLVWPRQASNIHSASRVLTIPVIAAVRSTLSRSAWLPRPVRTLSASLTLGTRPPITGHQRKTESPPIALSLLVRHPLLREINRRRGAAVKRAHDYGAPWRRSSKAEHCTQTGPVVFGDNRLRDEVWTSVLAVRSPSITTNAKRLRSDSGDGRWE